MCIYIYEENTQILHTCVCVSLRTSRRQAFDFGKSRLRSQSTGWIAEISTSETQTDILIYVHAIAIYIYHYI